MTNNDVHDIAKPRSNFIEYIQCPKCQGSGFLSNCPKCKGTGINKTQFIKRPCLCKQFTCDHCRGKGKLPVMSEDGRWEQKPTKGGMKIKTSKKKKRSTYIFFVK